jgi:hypothetical protein
LFPLQRTGMILVQMIYLGWRLLCCGPAAVWSILVADTCESDRSRSQRGVPCQCLDLPRPGPTHATRSSIMPTHTWGPLYTRSVPRTHVHAVAAQACIAVIHGGALAATVASRCPLAIAAIAICALLKYTIGTSKKYLQHTLKHMKHLKQRLNIRV